MKSKIQVVYHQRQEALLETLLKFIKEPLSHPFALETIVIESQAMQEWLSIKLAQKKGIFANVNFPFLKVLVWQLFQDILLEHDIPSEPSLSKENMTWLLLDLLDEYKNKPQFKAIRFYLSKDPGQLKRLQLAEKIAKIFDLYTIYRPEMILHWERGGEPTDWQAILWRELISNGRNEHRTFLQKKLVTALRSGQFNKEALPERLSVFGLSSLPPFYYEVLDALAAHIPIHCFVITPNLHSESTLPLLLSGSTQIQDFRALLTPNLNSDFELTAPQTLLGQVQITLKQNSILPGSKDETVQIHSLHSPLRELEHLKDFLLNAFDQDKTLTSQDILVMTPNLKPYGPLVEAVFGDGKLPFRIAEKTLRQESPVFKAFGDLLKLADSRFALSEVLGILEQAVIHQAFGLESSEIPLCAHWLDQVRVRWGIDREHREEMDLMPFAENTCVQGLERLLMGYALPGEGQYLIDEILPFDDIEGNSSQTLGKLLDFCTQIFSHLRAFKEDLNLTLWAEKLRKIPALFFHSDREFTPEINQLYLILDMLSQHQSHYEKPVSLSVVRSFLSPFLNKDTQFTGFSGQIAFSSLMPLRGIPARIICLLGMDMKYPSKNEVLDFDRMKNQYQPGDNNSRVNERYMFIEALMAARDTLYISYSGQSLKDNSSHPPSVVVSELIDTLELMTEVSEKKWIQHQPLSPIDPRYFSVENPYSYNLRAYDALKGLMAPKTEKVFAEYRDIQPLNEISIKDLVRFILNPSKWYIQKQLKIFLKDDPLIHEDTEVFRLNALEKYSLDQDLLNALIEKEDLDQFRALKKAEQILPVGLIGDYEFDREFEKAKILNQFIAHYAQIEPKSAEVEIDLTLEGEGGHIKLKGQVPQLYSDRRVAWRLAAIKAKDLLTHWIYHLVLCAQGSSHLPQETLIFGFNLSEKDPIEQYVFYQEPQAKAHLKSLVQLYLEGQKRPLPFYCEGSYNWLKTYLKEENENKAMQALQSKWVISGDDNDFGEGTDPYIQKCFQHGEYFPPEFKTLSQTVFKPLLLKQGQVA